MKRTPFWKNPGYRGHKKLSGDIECEYLIVGGGVLGLSLAYFLTRLGAKNIVVIEKNTIGSGATGLSAGMLVSEMEQTDLAHFEKRHGKTQARLWWDEQKEALEEVWNIVKREKLDCDAERDDEVILSTGRASLARLEADHHAREAIHVRAPELRGAALKKEIKTSRFKAAERVHWGISVNPLKYPQELSRALVRRGVRVYEHTALLAASRGTAMTHGGTIRYRTRIEATDAFSSRPSVRSFLTTIAVTQRLSPKLLREVRLADRDMFEETRGRSYHYGKITKDKRLLIGFGDIYQEDGSAGRKKLHKPHVANLRAFLKQLFPRASVRIEYAWSAVYGLSKSYLPSIRWKGNDLHVGGAGTQVVSTLTARYLAQRLMGRKQKLDRLFKL